MIYLTLSCYIFLNKNNKNRKLPNHIHRKPESLGTDFKRVEDGVNGRSRRKGENKNERPQ